MSQVTNSYILKVAFGGDETKCIAVIMWFESWITHGRVWLN